MASLDRAKDFQPTSMALPHQGLLPLHLPQEEEEEEMTTTPEGLQAQEQAEALHLEETEAKEEAHQVQTRTQCQGVAALALPGSPAIQARRLSHRRRTAIGPTIST